MKDEKKSIIEEALAEFNLIEETLNSNAKEILRSVAKEEITSTLNESLNEDEYDIEDIEDVDTDTDVDALPIDDAPDAAPEMGAEMGPEPEMGMEPDLGGSEELGLDDMGMDAGEEGLEIELGAEEGSEDYGLDMTGASDEEVISVYKKLQGEDEIEVVSSEEVIIKDPVSGAEYNVKMGGGSMLDQGEMDAEGGLGAEMGLDAEPEMGPEMGAELGPEVEAEPAMDTEVDAEPAPDFGGGEEETEVAPEGGEAEETEEEEDEIGEAVVYEIELSEDDEIVEGLENDLKINKDSKIGATADGKPRTATSDVEKNMTGDLATGDIEGQKAPNDSDSGDNLTGGFDDDAQNGSGDNHAAHIMEDAEVVDENENIDETVEVVDEEEVVEGEDAIDEKISTNGARERQAGGDLTKIKGPGARQTAKNLGHTVESVSKKYNTLLKEAKALKVENVAFKSSLKDFKRTMTETAIFNINLTHATKLFLEHSTTIGEKKDILTRFDEEVSTIEESKKLYKRINSELGNQKPLAESIENKLMSEQTSGQSTQINETVAYVDPAQKRVLDLINRTK